MHNFWADLPRPFFVLAPMDDVTDVVFRRLVASVAPPDVFFTEFASSDGWCSPGRKAVERKLLIEPDLSRPLVAQIWGSRPDHYYEMARGISGGGFAGIDINMGCPERGICSRGCCAALIRTPELASDIVRAVQAGTAESGTPLPVSVKTRLGYDRVVIEEWTGHLLSLGLEALTIHGRTKAQMSKVPADWDEIAKVVALRDQIAPSTIIIGNGDVAGRSDGLARAQASGVDGVMIGRGIFADILAFDPTDRQLEHSERCQILLRHLEMYLEQWGDAKSFHILRKFFKIYITGFPGAAEARARLMIAETPAEVRSIVADLALLPMR